MRKGTVECPPVQGNCMARSRAQVSADRGTGSGSKNLTRAPYWYVKRSNGSLLCTLQTDDFNNEPEEVYPEGTCPRHGSKIIHCPYVAVLTATQRTERAREREAWLKEMADKEAEEAGRWGCF